MIKLITSIFILFVTFILLIEIPSNLSFEPQAEYIVENEISKNKFAEDNPIAKGRSFQAKVLQGKSISERNKLLYVWRDELEEARDRARKFNKNIFNESKKIHDKYYYVYIRVFAAVTIVFLLLVGYFVNFYKWYDIFYLSFHFYLLVFGFGHVVSYFWIIALFLLYFFTIYFKETKSKKCNKE
ncbi:hypothetical protein [Bathymodiolus thermophilus thioautotrophic gill symbiont]|uniref:Uncharacterized protein n=1 Tax=Bathymodiolus thermophilus thioautotrophic gill symbiont TaxID=2360 RepID=A0A1J5U7H2_9GAMM|nr:hypothetical protein [Bathymodiolus thermophilus thioautotrophic gill symbiont]OIR24782.1 hypothetical protein BGC33_04595 [Bathymodiolus thermophilus thioautotrophic gill symbiont]